MQFTNLKLVFLFIGLMFLNTANAQYKIDVLDSNTFVLGKGVNLSKTSFRGLSVVDDNTIWVSGSKGTFARSINGGKTFVYTQIKGYEKSDFRDIEAFDKNTAVMMSSGTPAYILKTIDGGTTWKEVYKNTDTAYFLDAMDFWDNNKGVIVGDPIHNHFVILQTNNGGDTWQQLDTALTPIAMPGEAVFAASGTSLRCNVNYGGLLFVTGGKASRIIGLNLADNTKNWQYLELPMVKGESSQGAFSLANNDSASTIVGGDYIRDTATNIINSCIQYLPIKTNEDSFSEYINDVKGYRSCVEAINSHNFIACGTSGVDYYENKYWINISNKPFHVVRKAKNGKAVFLAGPNGSIGKLVINH